MSARLAKNALYLTIASVGQKLLSFGYFLVVARFLQPERTGLYAAALSLVTIFAVVADFGTPSIVIREVARRPEEALPFVRRALAVKIPMTLLAILLAFFASNALGYAPAERELVMLAAGVLACDSISVFFYGVLRGLHRLEYEALGMMMGQLVTLTVGLIALAIHPTLPMLILALTVGSLSNAILSSIQVVRRLGWKALLPAWTTEGIRAVIKEAWPFFLAAAFVKVYSSLDLQFLKWFFGNTIAGLYSVAYKFTFAFQFLPLAFVAALYPGMSALVGKKDTEGLGRLFESATRYLLLLAVPLAFGLSLVAQGAVALLGPQYAEAVPVLRVMPFILLPSFLDFPIGSLLNASGRQRTKTAIFGVTLLLNFALDFFLVPKFAMFGAIGGSFASLCFLVAAGMYFVPSVIPGFRYARVWRVTWPIALSGVAMAAIGWLTSPLLRHVHPILALLITVFVSIVAYVAALWLTGAVRPSEVRQTVASLRRSPEYAENPAIDA